MENITLELIRQLRQETCRGLYDCKIALQNSDTYEDAKEYLRKLGVLLIHRTK